MDARLWRSPIRPAEVTLGSVVVEALPDMSEPPTGTVTFLFTDIEGSTRLWSQSREATRIAVERHDDILRTAIEGEDQ